MSEEAQLEQYHYFATPVYVTKQPQFLDTMRDVATDSILNLHGKKKPNKIYPVRMSGSLLEDERVADFAEFIGNTAWNILANQGYAMGSFSTIFTELWAQEHYQTSSMDNHAHGGSAIVGFYFLDVPEEAPVAVFHDSRHGPSLLGLPEANPTQVTLASTMINFKPEPGMVLFAPAWVAHSFSRNPSKDPFRFIHFNLSVQQTAPIAPPAEVV